MAFLLVSFVAGLLTVLAPCILPLLPVVVGSSASGRSRLTPYVVVGSLSVSIILFTYLLKASTAFIMVPPEFWLYLSGGIVILFGLTLVLPSLWERVPGVSRLSIGSNKLVGAGYQKKSLWGDVLVGAALGPVFSTCSPTYFVILASVLPVSFLLGTVYLLAYVVGLGLMLLLIGKLGQRFADKLTILSDPRSSFKKWLGALFLILGLLIVTGYEKKLETAILDSGYFDVTKIEQFLLEKIESDTDDSTSKKESQGPYVEIVDPSGFVNTSGITLGELVGEKVILVDFLTYSCINCQRTFPYLNAWYEEYKDEGLEIVGIHTPEFAFERDIDNVREAMQRFDIEHPIVLDNDYATWRAYGNRFWPRKYLIDIHGDIVYDHIGEGAYKETEEKIIELLTERREVLGLGEFSKKSLVVEEESQTTRGFMRSPETYFGSLRNEYLANGTPGVAGDGTFTLPQMPFLNGLYLGGTWNITPEYAESVADASILYRYVGTEVYVVASADTSVTLEVWQDGELISGSRGEDVSTDGLVTIEESRLYKLVKNARSGEHVLELRSREPGLRFYAFTFG